jgi:EpsI family protein
MLSHPMSALSTGPASLTSRLVWFQIVFLVGLVAALYLPVVAGLAEMWSASDDFGHGFLVPFIAGYLVWLRRDALDRTALAPNPWGGIPLVLFAGLMLWIGKLGSVALLQEFSLLVMLAGLVLLLMGRRSLAVLALPIAYLIFMINIFGEASQRIHWPFQLLAAHLGVWLLQSFGLTVFLDAQYIHLPRIVLEVAKACSGIQYLTALIAIGIPLAYFTQRTWWRRIGLIGFAVVIAILGNGIRVALIGAWAYYGGQPIHGPYHVFQGLFVAWVGFGALFLGAWFLGKGPIGREAKERDADRASQRVVRDESGGGAFTRDRGWNRSWALAAGCLLLAIAVYYSHHPTAVPPVQDLSTFPLVIGEWRGEPVDPRTHFLPIEQADQKVVRVYRDGSGRAVNLSISYFERQQQGRELVTYPVVMKFHQDARSLDLELGSGVSHRVNQTAMRNGRDLHLATFWYDVNGRVLVDRYRVKFWTIWDAVTTGRANGAMVAVSTRIRNPGDRDGMMDAQRSFVRDVGPVLREYLPSEAL